MNIKENNKFIAFIFVMGIIIATGLIIYLMDNVSDGPLLDTLKILLTLDVVSFIVIFIYRISNIIIFIVSLIILAILDPIIQAALLLAMVIIFIVGFYLLIEFLESKNKGLIIVALIDAIDLDGFLDENQRVIKGYVVKSIAVLNIVGGILIFMTFSNNEKLYHYIFKQEKINVEQSIQSNDKEQIANEMTENKSTEESRAAEIERNRQNAEDNKRKMEAQLKTVEKAKEKTKMDFLIPIALECKWTEADVRNAVQVMENCGVKFDQLSNMGKKLDYHKGQFSCDIKDTPYDNAPLLRINTEGDHIERIYVELTSNCNLSYFVNNRPNEKEIFRHSYSNGYMLYINENSQELSRKAFDEIIFVDDKLDKLRDKIEHYVKSHNGKAIENGRWSAAIQLETDTHNNSVSVPITDLINSKIIYLGEFDYSVKSTTYGKDYDKYHAVISMNGDNVVEISNAEIN